jgi:baseplate J-like protein
MGKYSEEAKEVCTQIAKDEGIPTTEEELKDHFYQKLQDEGSAIANKSRFSPFFTLLSAIVTKPALWLITFMVDSVMPNLFLKWASGTLLEIIAWSRGLTRKPASKTIGNITFIRSTSAGDLPISAGVVISSVEIDGVVYQVTTTASGTILDGETSAEIPVIAADNGEAYNLQEGYYSILTTPVSGITQVRNNEDWLTQPGADIEEDDDLRERVRNVILQQSSFHTDAAYRSIISSFSGVDPDNLYFDHSAPRGPYTANAYILLDVGEPSQVFIDGINYHINDEGNHGHNDDLLAFSMPEIEIAIDIEVTPIANLTAAQRTQLAVDVANVIQAAFRGNALYPDVTRTKPFSTLSISNLGRDIHREVPEVYSLKWNVPNTDIAQEMNVARLSANPLVTVT